MIRNVPVTLADIEDILRKIILVTAWQVHAQSPDPRLTLEMNAELCARLSELFAAQHGMDFWAYVEQALEEAAAEYLKSDAASPLSAHTIAMLLQVEKHRLNDLRAAEAEHRATMAVPN